MDLDRWSREVDDPWVVVTELMKRCKDKMAAYPGKLPRWWKGVKVGSSASV